MATTMKHIDLRKKLPKKYTITFIGNLHVGNSASVLSYDRSGSGFLSALRTIEKPAKQEHQSQ